MAGKIVVACSVLHNMCVASRLEPVELTEEEAEKERRLQPDVLPPGRRAAAAAAPGTVPAAEALQRPARPATKLYIT